MIRSRVFYLLGVFLLFMAAAMAVTATWTFIEKGADRWAFVWSVLITAGAGAALLLGFAGSRRQHLSLKDSFSLVTLVWLLAGVFGALPFYFFGVFQGSFINAFFEAVSGFTTTGSTLIENIEILPRGLILWRSMIQWLGGMGIIVLFVAILPRLGFRNLNMFRAELPGPMAEKVVPRMVETARRLWLIYLGFTILQVMLLMLARVSLFDSIIHALTTMPTGGFSSYNRSVAALNNPAAEMIITCFMFAAGVNFALYYRLLRHDFSFRRNQEFRLYLGLTVLSTILVAVNIYPSLGGSLGTAIRQAAFQVVSIVTTTGYATVDFEVWPHFSRMLLFFLMFTGGCGGSTGGAMKQIRLLLLFKYAFRELYRMVHPSAVRSVKLGDQTVSEEMLRGVVGFSILYVVFIVFSSLVLAAMGLDFVTAFSAATTSLGNIGPGLGLVGPAHTFAVVPPIGRLLLCVMMILGRLEIYTILVLFLPAKHRFHNTP